jgi:hypothetical protein
MWIQEVSLLVMLTAIRNKHPELTFRHRASYIKDDRFANLQMLHFIYLFNKYVCNHYRNVSTDPLGSMELALGTTGL